MSTVPCKFCDAPTHYRGTRLCNNCWEITHRIDQFLRSEKGFNFIHNKLCDIRYVPTQGIGEG